MVKLVANATDGGFMKFVKTNEIIEKIMMGNITVFEILPMPYFVQGHLPRAIQAEVGEIELMAKRLGLNSESQIITYCASETCPNSHQAANLLESLGFKNVSVYSGGKKDWLDSGFKLLS